MTQLHGSLTLCHWHHLFSAYTIQQWWVWLKYLHPDTEPHKKMWAKNSFHWKKCPLQIGTVPKLSGTLKTDPFTLGTEHISCLFFFFSLPLFPLSSFLSSLFFHSYKIGGKISSKEEKLEEKRTGKIKNRKVKKVAKTYSKYLIYLILGFLETLKVS